MKRKTLLFRLVPTVRKWMGVITVALCPAFASAQSADDKVVISATSLNPGGSTAIVSVSIEGSTLYSAYEMDLTLPAGMEITYAANGNPEVSQAIGASSIYPSSVDELSGETTYSHLFGSSYNVVGTNVLRVSCLSLQSENLKSTSGVLFRFRVKAGPYTRPGDKSITVSNLHLIKKDASQHQPSKAPVGNVTITDNASVSVNVSATNHYGTIILPFDVPVLPEGLQAYSVASVSGDEISLEEQTELAAFTPYMLYSENGVSTTLNGKVDASKYVSSATAGYLIGVTETTSINEGFILQNQGDGAMFYMVAPYTYALSAGKCYLKLDANVNYSRLRFRFSDGEANAIDAASIESTSGPLYNLQGQRLSSPAKNGMYIKDGKKFINK